MQPNEVLTIIRKAVSESNKHFLLSYLDGNGFPHSNFMGFAHLNKNMTVIMMIRNSSERIYDIREQPWIELVFHTRDFSHVIKFFGKALITSSPPSVKKLINAYTFLGDYFTADGSDAQLIQLHTQMIEVESLKNGEKWHKKFSYMVENGELVSVDKPVLQGATLGVMEQNEGEFDAIRRYITKNHGDMLMCIIHGDYNGLLSFLSPNFAGKNGQSRDVYHNEQQERFKGLELANAEINWGLRDFDQKKDGSVDCLYFLEITPREGETISIKQKETWVMEGANWLILSME